MVDASRTLPQIRVGECAVECPRRVSTYRPATPEVSRFFGIVITINYDDHLPPHFHARYGDDRATFRMDGEILSGSMSKRAAGLVREWARMHEAELAEDWVRAGQSRPLVPIPPLV
jgi:hypothetical protein